MEKYKPIKPDFLKMKGYQKNDTIYIPVILGTEQLYVLDPIEPNKVWKNLDNDGFMVVSDEFFIQNGFTSVEVTPFDIINK